MSAKLTGGHKAADLLTAPTAVQEQFPVGAWLPKCNRCKSFGPELIAAVSVAAF